MNTSSACGVLRARSESADVYAAPWGLLLASLRHADPPSALCRRRGGAAATTERGWNRRRCSRDTQHRKCWPARKTASACPSKQFPATPSKRRSHQQFIAIATAAAINVFGKSDRRRQFGQSGWRR